MSAAANARIAALAADRGVHRAFYWLHLNELRLRQWQLQMVGVAAPPFGEAERAAWFVERFIELGLEEPRLDAIGNALAWLPAGAGSISGSPAPLLLLSAHLDTVFPAGTDCTPREDGARILAPGSCDNAAGLTALLALAAAMRAAEIVPACPILFAANVGEEGEGNLRGMRALFTDTPLAPRIAAAIALEGAGNATVVDRALGSRRFRLTVRGPGGHSWADAAQPNPIFALSEALAAVARIALPASPRTTLHCGTIHGGTSINSVPEFASATLDLRSVSAGQLAATATEVGAAIEVALRPSRLTFHLEDLGHRPAAVQPQHSSLLESLHAVDRHLHIATEARIGSTDANLPLSLGVPAVAIGAGGTGGGIHTLREWYDPTGREFALRRLLLLVLDTCRCIADG